MKTDQELAIELAECTAKIQKASDTAKPMLDEARAKQDAAQKIMGAVEDDRVRAHEIIQEQKRRVIG